MSRTRVIYQSSALFVGPSPCSGINQSTGIAQLYRVQSSSFDFNVARQNVDEFGVLGSIDRVIVNSPTVNFNFNYLVTNALNESGLGLVTDGSISAISWLLDQSQVSKNYFILTTPEGIDAVGYSGDPTKNTVIGIGNGYLSSYSVEARVGGFPTASIKVEGLNVEVYGSSSGQDIPAINPGDGSAIVGSGYTFTLPVATSGVNGMVSALRPGDIQFSVPSVALGVDTQTANIQRFTLGFDLQLEPQEKIGSRFAFAREIRFPVTVTMSIEANVSELTTGSLANLFCNDQGYNISVVLNKPSCPGQPGSPAMVYSLLNAKMDSQHFNESIGPNESVTLNFSTQIGSAAQTYQGLFISGVQV